MKKHAAFILCAVFLSVAVLGGPCWCQEQQPAGSLEQSQPPAYPMAPPAAQPPAALSEQAAVEGAYAHPEALPNPMGLRFSLIFLSCVLPERLPVREA